MSLSRKIGGRPLLSAGFGSLLALMPVAGGYALGTVEQVRAKAFHVQSTPGTGTQVDAELPLAS
jgi:hypothetical protein